MSFKTITFEKKENICYIGFGKYEEKSLTTLSQQTLQELEQAIDQVKNDNEAKGLIFFSHKKGCFLAGVDVSIIQNLNSETEAADGASAGQNIFNKIEDLKVSTMALIDGFCLGGGLELSLACDRIIVSDSSKTKLGLPEVMLGVLPGFGGTYRLPKKIGLTNALDMILTGKQVRAKKALKLDLADFMMPAERLLPLAPEYLFKKKKDDDSIAEKATSFAEDSFFGKKIIFQKARESVMSKTKGFYPAPLKVLEVLEKYMGKSREDFLHQEAKAFGELSQTTQSKNLTSLFFLQDTAKKARGEETDNLQQGAVLGAGTMGGGIAWFYAHNGIPSYMKDLNEEALNLGLKQASSNFSRALKRKRMTKDQFERKMRSISPVTTYSGFNNVDILIEAIVENMDIKKSVLSEVEKEVNSKTIITSNTSSLSIETMASALETPERFAGLHFFNPVHKMPLVEIITHSKLDEKVLNDLYNFVLACKKTPVIVKDGPGFLVNRILATYLNEAGHLLEEGYSIEDVDQAALDFGMPMGPCHLMDEVGIDVSNKVGKILFEGLGNRFKPGELSGILLDKNLLGKKNQKGFYFYSNSGKKEEINPELSAILPQSKKSGDVQALQMRMILPMVNEAAYCLEDKIVEKAKDIDLAMIFGIGFPPFRGGLLKYADDHGLERIVTALKRFQSEVSSERFAVSSLLDSFVEKKMNFYDF